MTSLGIQASKARAEAEKAQADAKRSLEDASWISSRRLNQDMLNEIQRAQQENRIAEAKQLSEYDLKTAKDQQALYDYYADYYGHTPGDRESIYKFNRKYSWYYDPRMAKASELETGWRNYQVNAVAGAGKMLSGVGSLIGGASKGAATIMKAGTSGF